jgi:hypothetical protein
MVYGEERSCQLLLVFFTYVNSSAVTGQQGWGGWLGW